MRVVPAVDDTKVQAVAVGIEYIGLRISANQHTSSLNLGYDNSASNFVYVVSSITSLHRRQLHNVALLFASEPSYRR